MFVETSVSTAKVEEKQTVLWCYKADAVLTLSEAQEEIAQICSMIDTHMACKAKLLIDIRGLKSMDRASRKLFSSDYISDNYVTALAIVLGNAVSKIIGNLYLRLNKPKHPVRLFSDIALAREWLHSIES